MYHHGNLKETLIETGIDYVNKNGYSTLSLRKLATMCNVSHPAVYKHFNSKEDLFGVIAVKPMKEFSNQTFGGVVTQVKSIVKVIILSASGLGIKKLDLIYDPLIENVIVSLSIIVIITLVTLMVMRSISKYIIVSIINE